MLYNVITKGDCIMKDKLIQIRADAELLAKIEYLKFVNGWRTVSETVRKIIEKEYRKERGNNG